MQVTTDLIFGRKGSGKTQLAKHLLLNCPRALVADAAFSEFPAQEFYDYPAMVNHLSSIKAFADSSTKPPKFSYVPFRVSYSFSSDEEELIFDTAKELGNVTLFLEEADRFSDPRHIQAYSDAIIRGRHWLLSIVAIGLYPALLPKRLRGTATSLYSFQQIEPADIEAVANIAGELAYELPNLKKHHYLYWSPDTGARICEPVKI